MQSKYVSTIFLPAAIRFGARLLAWVGPRSLNWKNTRLVFRWQDVAEVLRSDTMFRIAPVNASRIEAVSGAFILGMDRSDSLFRQRDIAFGALAAVGCHGVRAVVEREAAALLEAAARSDERIDLINGYARLVAARVAVRLFGITGPSETELMRVVRAVFHETFLNLSGDEAIRDAGITAGKTLTGWIDSERNLRRRSGTVGDDVLAALMQREDAGNLSTAESNAVLAGLLVGSIDTTSTAVAHILFEAMRNLKLMRAMTADLDRPARLKGWCMEALRRRPHNPILLREAGEGAVAAGRAVPVGGRVIAVTIAAMQDRRMFDDPAAMRPDRPDHLYLHFGHGLHLCAGRDINALQIPHLVATALRFGPTPVSSLRMSGPFPETLFARLGRTP